MAIIDLTGALKAVTPEVRKENPLDLTKTAFDGVSPFNRDDALKQAAGYLPGGAIAGKAGDIVTASGNATGALTGAVKHDVHPNLIGGVDKVPGAVTERKITVGGDPSRPPTPQMSLSADQPVDLEKAALDNLVKLQKQVSQTVASGLSAEEQIKELGKIERQMRMAHAVLGKELDFGKVVGKALDQNAEKFAQRATREQAIAARDDLNKVAQHFNAKAPLANEAVNGKIAVFDRIAQEQATAQTQAAVLQAQDRITEAKGHMKDVLLDPKMDTEKKMELLKLYGNVLKDEYKVLGKGFGDQSMRDVLGEIMKSNEFKGAFEQQLKTLPREELIKLQQDHDKLDGVFGNGPILGLWENNAVQGELRQEINRRDEIAKEQAAAQQQAVAAQQATAQQQKIDEDRQQAALSIKANEKRIGEIVLDQTLSPERKVEILSAIQKQLAQDHKVFGDIRNFNGQDMRNTLGRVLQAPDFEARFDAMLAGSSKQQVEALIKDQAAINTRFANGIFGLAENDRLQDKLDSKMGTLLKVEQEQAAAQQQVAVATAAVVQKQGIEDLKGKVLETLQDPNLSPADRAANLRALYESLRKEHLELGKSFGEQSMRNLLGDLIKEHLEPSVSRMTSAEQIAQAKAGMAAVAKEFANGIFGFAEDDKFMRMLDQRGELLQKQVIQSYMGGYPQSPGGNIQEIERLLKQSDLSGRAVMREVLPQLMESVATSVRVGSPGQAELSVKAWAELAQKMGIGQREFFEALNKALPKDQFGSELRNQLTAAAQVGYGR